MIKYVKNPNLPDKTDVILIGEKYKHLLSDSLSALGLKPLWIPDNPFVDSRISGHADLSLCHGGGNKIFAASHLLEWAKVFMNIFPSADIDILDISQSRTYPHDCQLNVCAIGNNIVCSEDISSERITNYFLSKAYHKIYVKQGYCKCSICVVDENSVISSDRGISQKLQSIGIDVLEISPGYVQLTGFDYGFIGGASFKISKDVLAFTGKLDLHPDKDRIIDFLDRKNISPVYLTDFQVFDIGGAIPLTEK